MQVKEEKEETVNQRYRTKMINIPSFKNDFNKNVKKNHYCECVYES